MKNKSIDPDKLMEWRIKNDNQVQQMIKEANERGVNPNQTEEDIKEPIIESLKKMDKYLTEIYKKSNII